MLRRADRAGLDRDLALLDDAVGDFLNHLLEQQTQMRVWTVVRRRDVFDTIGVS